MTKHKQITMEYLTLNLHACLGRNLLLLIISLPVFLIGQNIEFDKESGLYTQVEVLEFEN